MILTDAEIRQLRDSIEAQAGMNEELLRRCGGLIHMGSFDEAVRSAFVLLEERLRKAAHKEGLTGTRLANYAFDVNKGPLAIHLAKTTSEREGLRDLYVGAFKLFRNPTAHGLVGYTPAEGKSIIGLVNLLLIYLERVEELPPPDSFPENVERAIITIEQKVGPGIASRVRLFMGKCKKLGLEPRPGTASWIPFRRYALMEMSQDNAPKPHKLTVFYVMAEEKKQGFWFPVNQYYSRVVDFDLEQLSDSLRALGFMPSGKNRDFQISFKEHNSQEFFDALFQLVEQTSGELEETLQAR